MAKVKLTVNGRAVSGDCEDRTLLVHFIREKLGLTGTHVGCDTNQCGACVVHMDGKSVKSCGILAVQASGSTITTVEGLAINGELHPVQAAFKENHGLQCGYCTSGMVMSVVALLNENPKPSDPEIREALEGNICRCTGYQGIVEAVQLAAERIAAGAKPEPIKA